MRIAIIVQARIHSTRLPRKALLDICGKTALERVVDRCKMVDGADDVVVACPFEDELPIYERTGIPSYPGPEHDLVTRLLGAARMTSADKFVRVTADCPLIDPAVIQRCINISCAVDEPIVSNWVKRQYPNGQDCEVYNTRWFAKYAERELSMVDREWFALKMSKEEPVRSVICPWDASKYRMTLDYVHDLTVIREMQRAMQEEIWGWERCVQFLRENPKIANVNAKYEKEFGDDVR